jgi:hypothetical protein
VAVVWAGIVYFLLVFAAGAVLGFLRQLVIIPQFGTDTGFLIEFPLLLAAIALSARFIVSRFNVPARVGPRLGAGAVALAFLLLTENAIARLTMHTSYLDVIATYSIVARIVSALLLLALLLMPALLLVRR